MKVIIENWGPVGKCEYDLDKSMIVTYGENNIGKSYCMQVLYLLLKNMISYAGEKAYVHQGIFFYSVQYNNKQTFVKNMVMEFSMDETNSSRDITQDLIDLFGKSLESDFIPMLDRSFINTFGIYENILKKNPRITVHFENGICCEIFMKEKHMSVKMDIKPIFLKKAKSDFHKSKNYKTHYDIYVYENHVKTPIELIGERLSELRYMFSKSILMKVNQVFFLPASRSGIYTGMSSFGSILAQLSQSRAYIKGGFQIPSISEPVSDYYMILSSIKSENKGVFWDIAEDIERDILKGRVSFDSRKQAIVYRNEDMEQDMEMSDVSSMVSEISPVTAYLKYIIRGNCADSDETQQRKKNNPASVLFIEEPEAHLHPANQVGLVKIFIKLSQRNVKLVMASHSNYVFNELNNRVISGELDKTNYLPILMKYENGRTVSQYMQMDELGVDDENFSDISDEIYEEREQLISCLADKLEKQDSEK